MQHLSFCIRKPSDVKHIPVMIDSDSSGKICVFVSQVFCDSCDYLPLLHSWVSNCHNWKSVSSYFPSFSSSLLVFCFLFVSAGSDVARHESDG